MSWISVRNQNGSLVVGVAMVVLVFTGGCNNKQQASEDQFFEVPKPLGNESEQSSSNATSQKVDSESKSGRGGSQSQNLLSTKTRCLIEIRASPQGAVVTVDRSNITADPDAVFRSHAGQKLTDIVVSKEGYLTHAETLETGKASLIKLIVELKRDHEFLLERANQKLANRDFVAALGDLAAAINLQPESFEAVRLQTEILLALGHPELAKQQLERSSGWAEAEDVRNELAPILIELGKADLEKSNFAGAIEDLNHAIELDAQRGDLFHSRGVAYEKTGNWSAAVADFDRAIALDPSLSNQLAPRVAFVLTGQAKTLANTSKLDDAIKSLDKAMSYVENYLPALELRGPLLIKVEDFLAAEDDLVKIMKARPETPQLRGLLGQARAGQEKFEAAAEQFEKNLNIEPHRAEALLQLGFCALRLNRNDEAIGRLSQAIEQGASNPQALLMRGVAELNTGKVNAAVKDLRASIEASKSPTAEMYYFLGVALEQQNQFSQSLDCYDAAITADANHIPARLNRSILLTQNGALDKALDDTKSVLRLSDSNPVAWNNHGVVLNAKGEQEEAIDSFSAAIDNAPDYAEAWFNRGQLKFRRRSFADSIADLNRAIEIEDNVAEYWLVRAQIKMQLADEAGAKSDAEKSLMLDPQNGPARELMKVLSSASADAE